MIIKRSDADKVDFDGLGILDYTAAFKGLSASMASIEIPPGAAHAVSWSVRSDKYYLVIAGNIRFTVEDDVFELESGDFCLVRQGQKFSYQNMQERPATLVLVHTPPFDLDSEMFED